MITNTQQKWNIGDKVNVGFMKGLTVLAIRSEKDGMPDIYELVSSKGVRYDFIPHNGLTRIW